MSTKYNLVLRNCACGCGKTWRCLSSSTSEYFSELHILFRAFDRDGNRFRERDHNDKHVEQRVTELFEQNLSHSQIKDVLNDKGYKTTRGNLFTSGRVYMIMSRLGLKRSRFGGY